MKSKSFGLLVAALVLISLSIQAQKQTYLGAEFAVCSDLYEIVDPCNLITTTPLITGSWGFIIDQEIHDNFSIETGFIRKYYSEGIGYNVGIVTGTSSNEYETWQIPLRLKAKMNLVKQKLFLTATIGYSLSFNSEYGNNSSVVGGGYWDGGDTIKVDYTINNSLAKNFSLIETGIGLEYVVIKNFNIYLSSSYYSGLKRVIEMDMYTGNSTCSSDEAYGLSKGSYWNIAFGMKYAISNFWKK